MMAPPAVEAEPRPADLGQADDRALVRQAWELVAPRADRLVRTFYAELFHALGDEAFTMFPSSMTEQRDDFARTLVQWVVADDPAALHTYLQQLGADHRKFDVETHHYDIAGAALVNAWSRLAGERWTPDIERAVGHSYTRLATAMIDGARRHDREPASWTATVTAHERRGESGAMLRIRPDKPYPFRPGQHLTLEHPRHTRVWRQMSFASAPRTDNTFDLQVRAAGAVGVSGALVAHTEPGDRLRLGPPRDTGLVVDPQSFTSGLLCLCSGIGAAPVTAVVESMLSQRDGRPVYVFVGGTGSADLWAVTHLMRLVESSRQTDRVRVHGVASNDSDYPGFHGQVEQLVPSLHPWAQLGLDAVVAGDGEMTTTAVAGLTAAGLPPDRIHVSDEHG